MEIALLERTVRWSASKQADMIQVHGAPVDVSTEPRNECVFDIGFGEDENPVVQRVAHECLLKRISLHGARMRHAALNSE
jgi:hypothetical protein